MSNTYKLATDWNFISLGMNPKVVADTLNTIINDGVATNAFKIESVRTNQRINNELERRGIDYRISKKFTKHGSFVLMFVLMIPRFVAMHQMATALNLLSQDYNSRGC